MSRDPSERAGFHPYIIFGESKDGRRVDVADINGDVVTGISRAEAERLIADRDKLLDALDEALWMYQELC